MDPWTSTPTPGRSRSRKPVSTTSSSHAPTPGGEAIRLLDKTAHVYIDQDEQEGGLGRPEIDRKVLRKMLVDSLEPGTIRWGSKVVAVRSVGSGHELELTDGRTVHADLLIGADGAWSKVRTLLTSVQPEYTGITAVQIWLSDATTKHPAALAREILRHADVDEAITAYEQKMFPRGAKAAAMSAKSLDTMFADGPPRKLVALFRGMILLSKVTRPFERIFRKAKS